MAARSRRAPEANPTPSVVVAAPVKPVSETPLVEEHVLAEDGLTLRAGFAHAPQVGSAELAVIFSGVSGTPRVEVALQPEHGREQTTNARFVAAENRWHAPITLAAGKQHLRVIAHSPKGGAPLILAFDVETRGALPAHPIDAPTPEASSERSARPAERRTRPPKEDDLPVTIVPADPHPPRAIVATPAPPSHSAAAPPTPANPPSAPAPYPTTRVVVDHPKPVRQPPPATTAPTGEPPPAPEQPAQDPPSRPNDPTTLPPPGPDEPR
jgi:hypothetical protein